MKEKEITSALFSPAIKSLVLLENQARIQRLQGFRIACSLVFIVLPTSVQYNPKSSGVRKCPCAQRSGALEFSLFQDKERKEREIERKRERETETERELRKKL